MCQWKAAGSKVPSQTLLLLLLLQVGMLLLLLHALEF
jgi:hypothetical protein